MRVLKIKEQEIMEAWENNMKTGKATAYTCINPDFCQTVDVAEVILTPGARTKLFSMDIDWVVQVIEGGGTLGTDKEQNEITPGTIAHIPAGEPRWIAASEGSTLVFMSTHRPQVIETILE